MAMNKITQNACSLVKFIFSKENQAMFLTLVGLLSSDQQNTTITKKSFKRGSIIYVLIFYF